MSVSIDENAYNLRSRKIVKRKLPQTLEPRPRSKKTRLVEEGDEKVIFPKAFAYEPPSVESESIMPLKRKMTEEEMYAANRREWMTWAEKALEHYNLKEDSNYKLLEVRGVQMNTDVPKRWIHMNFNGTLDDGASSNVFFAELVVPWEEPGIEVKGCCTLKEGHSGHRNTLSCDICFGELSLHPGSRYGYCSGSGYNFNDACSAVLSSMLHQSRTSLCLQCSLTSMISSSWFKISVTRLVHVGAGVQVF